MPQPVSQIHGGDGGASAFGGVWAKEEAAAIAIATAVSTAGVFSFVMDFSFAVVSRSTPFVTAAWRMADTVAGAVTARISRPVAVVKTWGTRGKARAKVKFSACAPLARLWTVNRSSKTGAATRSYEDS